MPDNTNNGGTAMDVMEQIERACDEIHRICQNPRQNFRMSIPVNEERDSDCIITGALAAAKAEIERLRAGLAEATHALDRRVSVMEKIIGSIPPEVMERMKAEIEEKAVPSRPPKPRPAPENVTINEATQIPRRKDGSRA